MSHAIDLLLVEDSVPDARLITEVFRAENIEVDITVMRDGEEAMSYLQSQASENARIPDLIILDLNLPNKDGREVLAEIKNDSILKSIPIIVLTTSDAEEDITHCYKLQASCYIKKPIDLNQFVRMVKSLDAFWFASVRFPRSHV